VNLAPNEGASPAGEYYTAVFYMSDGSTSTQYWVVPSTATATLAQLQAQVMPAAQAVKAVSKTYVDEEITQLRQSLLTAWGGTLSGPLYLYEDPTKPMEAATKHYVDQQVATAVPLAGGNMLGSLTSPEINGVESPATVSSQTTLQETVNAAGTTGAVEIPPNYTGTDTFTNNSGVMVTDLRSSVAQQRERSVKEFGAVCDGATDDTTALQTALNYAHTIGVALTIPQGTCKTQTLLWRGETIGGLGKQVSALKGFPGEDVLASGPDETDFLTGTRLHDLTIYVDQSTDVSCAPAEGRASAGSCKMSRAMEPVSIFSSGGNGLTNTAGSGAAWWVGNCAIAMKAAAGTGGNGLKMAAIENVAIATTGSDPLATSYAGAHSTHTCGMYLAQWPAASELRNIDIKGVNTGVAIPALAVTTPVGLTADGNRWQNLTIEAAHAFTAAAGSNNVLDNFAAKADNSAATAEPPTGLVLDFASSQQGWTIRNTTVTPTWDAVAPALTVTASGGAVTAVTVGSEAGLGWDPYGTSAPVAFSGSCTAAAKATVNSSGAITGVTVTSGGTGCSSTTTASINEPGTWDTAAPVNLISGQDMSFFGGNLLNGNGGYTVWNAGNSASYGTQLDGGGGTLAGGGNYAALTGSGAIGKTYDVDQFPGVTFGGKLQSCINTVSTTSGGTCDARNFTGNLTITSNLTIATPNTTLLLPCATITTAYEVVVGAGVRNTKITGCAYQGGSATNGAAGGTVWVYTGSGNSFQVGDTTYTVNTAGFKLQDMQINLASAGSSSKAFYFYRSQEIKLEDLYLIGNGAAGQFGITLDGTGNYSGGYFENLHLSGFGKGVYGTGHLSGPVNDDYANASTFTKLHIDCTTSSGSPVSGTFGIDIAGGDGNTFNGGDVEGCATALHLGPAAVNNTLVGLRNENSTSQVVADSGSKYNSWVSGGTMFTGQLTDNGTRNSFLDSFHRSFNGMNGDWYGSQTDATVTNHWRLGTGAGNERGLLNEVQTDYGYRWIEGFSDATGGEQFYQIQDLLNNVYRISVGQYLSSTAGAVTNVVVNSGGCYSSSTAPTLTFSGGSGAGAAATATMTTTSSTLCSGGYMVASVSITSNGSGYTSQPAISWSGSNQITAPNAIAEITPAGSANNQTAINSAGTGAVVLNGSANAGTGGVIFSSGGTSPATVATVDSSGDAQFTGTLLVGGTTQSTGTLTVRNNADAEADYYLRPGLTTSQKGSFTYKDYNGTSEWYMVKDASNNWSLNSALGGLDSFKAYQSTNSGDTYINASNSSGHIRMNYESGSGAETDIYSGSSTSLDAAFLSPTAIKFPGLAAVSGQYCLQIDTSGYITNTGSACGTGTGGTSGTVNAGVVGQIAYYASAGTALSGLTTVPITSGGTGANSASSALANLLPGASSDGNKGLTVTGAVAATNMISQASPFVDIRAYGATIDGATDISSSLLAAVNAAGNTAGGSQVILLPCGGAGCYLANGSILKSTAQNNYEYTLKLQGKLILGSTLLVPDGMILAGDSGGGGASFQIKGPTAYVQGPSVSGTMGTTITTTGSAVTFTPTFTTGSISNFHVGSVVTVAGTVSATASASATAYAGGYANVTVAFSTETRIAPGSVITVTGCSSSAFNVSQAPVVSTDYSNYTLTYPDTAITSSASATGCVITGPNEDSFESVIVTAVSGSTVTALFNHTHTASDLWGMAAITTPNNTFNHHEIDNISVNNCQGACLAWIQLQDFSLSNDGFQAINRITSIPAELADVALGSIRDSTFDSVGPNNPSVCKSACATASYPEGGLRCTHSLIDSTLNEGGCGYVDIYDSTFIGGIKVDNNSITGASLSMPSLYNNQAREVGASAITVDNRYGTVSPFIVDNMVMEDNFLGATSLCYLGFTDSNTGYGGGYADFRELSNADANCIVNSYFNGQFTASNVDGLKLPAGRIAPVGTLTDGGATLTENRGQGSPMGPNLIPYSTLATSSISSACGSYTCNAVMGPDGVAGSATEIIAGASGGASAVTVGSMSFQTYSGDHFIAGAWVHQGTGQTALSSCSGANSAQLLASTGTDTVVGNTAYYGMNLVNDWWHPQVALYTVTTGESTAHTVQLRLYPGCSSGEGNQFWQPFWIFVPGPNNPNYTKTYATAEVERWRQELLHGYVPSGLSATGGILAMAPGHKLYWGADTDLYRAAAGVLQTDGTMIAPYFNTRTGSSIGGVILNNGDSTHSGYLEFDNMSGTRNGYLGYDTGTNVTMHLENSGAFNITGGYLNAVSGLQVNGVAVNAPSETYNSSASGIIALPTADRAEATYILGGNVTSTTIAAGIGGAKVTILICQPTSGGPYTWTWPSNWRGGMTIGTSAGTCSEQIGTYIAGLSDWHGDAGTTNIAQ
jgi:hypothetical protein